MLGAALIHPDMREVIPLMPEPIVKQDGTAKNDCERNAAKRFLVKLRQDHPHLKCIVTEDSLSSNAPHIETLHAHGLHYILGVKEGEHPYLFQQVQAAEHLGRVTSYERHDRAAGLVHRFRFVNEKSRRQLCTQLRAWPAKSVGGICGGDDARVFGGADAAAVLCLVPGGVEETGQQAPVVGAHAIPVLYLPPRVHARVVGSPVLWLGEISPHFAYRYI